MHDLSQFEVEAVIIPRHNEDKKLQPKCEFSDKTFPLQEKNKKIKSEII